MTDTEKQALLAKAFRSRSGRIKFYDAMGSNVFPGFDIGKSEEDKIQEVETFGASLVGSEVMAKYAIVGP